jgi:flagellar motor switch protein FliM
MVAGIIAFHAGLPPGIWEVPIPVAFAAIDCMLGGRGNAIPEDMRDLTPVQAAVLSRFLNDILSTWAVAWSDLSVISPHIERVVTSNAVAAATGRVDSQTIHMRLSVKIAAAEGVMNVALPITAMQRVLREGHLEGRHGAVPSRERIAKAPLGKHAPRFPCGVRVVLRAPKLTLRRLLSLHPGDLIDLQCPADEPFVMIVGDHDKFAATPGVSRGLVAARIEKPLTG